MKKQIPWNKGKKLSKKHRINLSKSHLGQKAWNKGLNRITKVCLNCSKEFNVKVNRKDSAKYCCVDCYAECKKGTKLNYETKRKMSLAKKVEFLKTSLIINMIKFQNLKRICLRMLKKYFLMQY